MNEIPIGYFDNTTEIIHIQGPGNQLSIGPIFTGLQQLVVLRIVDSNVPAIGQNSFWYMPNMKILGKLCFSLYNKKEKLKILYFRSLTK